MKNISSYIKSNINNTIEYYSLCILFIVLYILVIIYSINKLSFVFGYMGINFFVPDQSFGLIIPILCILPIFRVNKLAIYPSDYINLFIYIFLFIPAVVVPPFIIDPKSFNYDYIVFLFVLLLSILFIQRTEKGDTKNILLDVIAPISPQRVTVVFLILYSILFGILLLTFGFNFTLPSLDEIYDVRLEFREIVKGTVFSQYIIGWLGYILNPFILLLGLHKKNKFLIVSSILSQLYLFSILALKSHLAIFIVLIFIYHILKKKPKIKARDIIGISSCFLVCIFFIDFVCDSILLQSIITRRVVIVPAQLSYYHFEFFDTHTFTYWGHSIFKSIFDYTYELPPPKLIGDKYFGKPEMTAVVGVFMEGYTAFGYIGLVVVTLLMKVVLNIFDYIYIRSNYNLIVLTLSFIFVQIINSTSILTLFITHGLLVLFLIEILYPWGILNKKTIDKDKLIQ